jgi:hypothetical protein
MVFKESCQESGTKISKGTRDNMRSVPREQDTQEDSKSGRLVVNILAGIRRMLSPLEGGLMLSIGREDPRRGIPTFHQDGMEVRGEADFPHVTATAGEADTSLTATMSSKELELNSVISFSQNLTPQN